MNRPVRGAARSGRELPVGGGGNHPIDNGGEKN